MMSYTNLVNYYRLTFQLAQHHKYSLAEIDNLIPFERDIYVGMLLDYLQEEKERQERRK
jgi:hypothetical protein